MTRPLFRAALVLTLLLSGIAGTLPQPASAAPAKPAAVKATPARSADVPPAVSSGPQLAVTAIELIKHPDQYLNKTVKFDGEFTGFTGLGLDYPKALRTAKEYVGLLVRRPDVRNHIIPLSELKMFYPRSKSETLTSLEAGDQIAVVGSVFSNALGEPWIDVTAITITKKKPK